MIHTSVSGTGSNQAPELEQAPPSATIAGLKGTILAGANGPEGRLAADQLGEVLLALAHRAPTAETRDLLRELLDQGELDRFVDTDGTSCRAALIGAQLALGFPFALEVTPEDLKLLRQETTEAETRGRNNGTRFAAAFSMLWNASAAILVVLLERALGQEAHPAIAAAFGLGAAHGLLAVLTARARTRSKSPRERVRIASWYRALAWTGLIAPVLAVLAVIAPSGLRGIELTLGSILAAPTIVTGLVFAFHSSRIVKPGDDRPVAPR